LIALFFNKISPEGIPVITKFRNIKIQDTNIKVPLFLSAKRIHKKKDIDIVNELQSIKEINIEKVQKIFMKGNCIFFDARSTENYMDGHIPGAISIPIEEIGFDEIDIADIDFTEKIITYCDGEECHLSVELAVYLEEIGFMNVNYFIGGWSSWIGNDNQVSKGSTP